MDGTMVVALLQPAPETYELFDDLILLSEGQIVFQGPRELVTDFFEQMGFKCPDRKNIADFLQEVWDSFRVIVIVISDPVQILESFPIKPEILKLFL